jgi:hypothetical protein
MKYLHFKIIDQEKYRLHMIRNFTFYTPRHQGWHRAIQATPRSYYRRSSVPQPSVLGSLVQECLEAPLEPAKM